jgi:DNA replication protein DnaC
MFNEPGTQKGRRYEVFADDVVAAAILDRLLHHSYPFLIQGKSYRMKEIMGGKKKLEKKDNRG